MGRRALIVPGPARLEGRQGQRRQRIVRRRRQGGRPDAAQLFRPRMDVDQGLRRLRPVEQGVALGWILAHARADDQQQVRVLDPSDQLRVWPQTEVARIGRMVVADQVLAAEGQGDRQAQTFGPGGNRVGRRIAPARTAQDQHRPFGLAQPLAHLFDEGRVQRGFCRDDRTDRGGASVLVQDVLGQGDDDRAHAALLGDGEGALDHLDGALRALDLGGPFGQAAEDFAIVDLLEGAAAAVGQGDLADEQDHRRRILMRRMHADRGVGRARPARDHADAGTARQLAIGLGHVGGAGLVAADDDLDLVAHVGQGVEHGEIALARHAEDLVDPVHHQGFDQTAGGGSGGLRHKIAVSRLENELAMQPYGPASR
ncbi:hypothetical protein D3C77_208570 [compost metagenome]